MTAKITASTTSGLVLDSDMSGSLALVAGGVTVATLNGTGANAEPVINAAGYLIDATVTDIGTNYTYANPVISVLSGYNTPNIEAVAVAAASPVGGHGLDPISELGCNNVMISLEF